MYLCFIRYYEVECQKCYGDWTMYKHIPTYREAVVCDRVGYL